MFTALAYPLKRLWKIPACLFALIAGVCRAELRLVCILPERELSVAGVVDGRVLLDAGGTQRPAPQDARWRLDGDLREHAALVRWSPRYSIYRDDSPDALRDPALPFVARITVTDGTIPWPEPDSIRDSFLRREVKTAMRYERAARQDWPAFPDRPGLLIFAWRSPDGSTAILDLHPTPGRDTEPFRASVRTQLGATAAAGQPVLLWWSDGGFVPVQPFFEDPAANRLVAAACLDDVDAFTGAPSVRERSREGLMYLHYAARAGSLRVVELLLQHVPMSGRRARTRIVMNARWNTRSPAFGRL